MRKTPFEKEWNKQCKTELRFAAQKQKGKRDPYEILEKYVPDKLQGTLETAFVKGFHLVFSKGDPLIQRTLAEEKHTDSYRVNEFKMGLRSNRKNLRSFSRKAASTGYTNLLFSGLEGLGLGALGIGLPDIPLFIGALLRNIYQICLDYGFPYDSPAERIFILKLIQGAVSHGTDFTAVDGQLNLAIDQNAACQSISDDLLEAQIIDTANALSAELLYAKFVQGIPIAGILGGISNISCMHQVTQYAKLKYNRRFLVNMQK
ncbi:MAG: EcsC family protein [Clostridiales bacterium]|nr:EcsC family protein [Clostridiales bacterium]